MKYSTKSRYALRLMVDLTLHANGDYIALKDISERQNISVKYLEQIVSVLGKSGMLKSVRGPQGGYKLAKDPSEYTAGDILRITEGNLAPIPCLENEENDCDRISQCATLDFWKGLYDAVNNYVDGVTLQELAERFKLKSSVDFII